MYRRILALALSLCLLVSAVTAADLSITAANVAIASTTGARTSTVQWGETITAGMCVYKKASDGKYYKSDNDVDSATANALGIALTGGSADGYGIVMTAGTLNIGATTAKGMAYVVSDTAGGIRPVSDTWTTGEYITHLGYATNTTGTVVLGVKAHSVQVP